MQLDPSWQATFLGDYPSGFPTAQTLISNAGSAPNGLAPERSRALVGLVEDSWSNPLFVPEGGFPAALLNSESPYYLPASSDQSLLSSFCQGRGLYGDSRLFGFVLVANEGGAMIGGSYNHWQILGQLSKQQLLGEESVYYCDVTGQRHAYSQQLLPTKLNEAVGINEFTLDILAVKTFNQYADIAIFIVPDDTLQTLPSGNQIDLTDYRLAPLPADVAQLPLVVSSSHGGGSSLLQRQDDGVIQQWPDPPQLPPSYPAQDNTGLVLTLSAGDQVAGIDLLDKGSQAQPLTFNTLPSSSPLFLTVGGVKLKIDSQGTVTGAEAWRRPSKKDKAGAAMEGGNGGFTAAAAMPAYQQVSPWVRQFRELYLGSSLDDAWNQPGSGEAFPWWRARGKALSLGDRPELYSFRSGAAPDSDPLTVNPALARLMPDLANLAWQDDFLSVTLSGDADLTRPDWPSLLAWHADGGTSLAAPATASLLAAVNVQRRQQELADLSATEVHYLLYQLPPALLADITTLQEQPAENTTAYQAYPGFDFASGLGAVSGSGTSELLQTLSTMAMALMPERTSSLPDVIFKPGGLPLLLGRLQGRAGSLRLVRMNGYAVNALLLKAEADPAILESRLLVTLEQARRDSEGSLNAVEFEVLALPDARNAADPASLVNQPLSAFLGTEGVAVASDSLLHLDRLPDIYPGRPGQEVAGMPAYYALLDQAAPGEAERSLTLQPFQANQGALLRQGGLLKTPTRDSSFSLVFSTLQRPLLQADVAAAIGAGVDAAPRVHIELVLRSVADRANLYGLYRVSGTDGALLDGQGRRVMPGDAAYAALAIKAAVGQGNNSLLWAAPDHASASFLNSCDWTDPATPKDGESLAIALDPGANYQHFIITAPTREARQALVRSLLQGEPGPEVLDNTRFALARANPGDRNYALGLVAEDPAQFSIGFEDLLDRRDDDYNDVIATWDMREGGFGIGSTTLVDLLADRIPDLAVGSQKGSPSTVVVVATNSGESLQSWQPFGPDDTAGVLVESGDVNADGFDDLVAVRQSLPIGAAAALAAEVQVLFGAASPLPQPARTLAFTAFGGAATGPLSLAVRDLDLDGYAEIALTATNADAQRRSLALELWSFAGGTAQRRTDLPLPSTAALEASHGYAVALGDLDGNGSVELVLGDQQGGDLFVGSIPPTPQEGATEAIAATVLQPYGKGYSQGVRPTVVSAQQTLVQRPAGLAAEALPWSLGAPRGSRQALLGGLGTPGALIVQSANGLDPRPAQVPLAWLSGEDSSAALVAIPWDSRSGAPVFSSGGVSYPAPSLNQPKPDLLQGEPQPILVAAAAGSTTVGLLSGPGASASVHWQAISDSSNTIASNAAAGAGPQTQVGWISDWGANSGGALDASQAREQFSQVSTELVSYSPPFELNLNPMGLSNPQQLLADLAGHASDYLQQVVQPWNSERLLDPAASPWGPGAPGSSNDPYRGPDSPNLPTFTPSFTPLPPPPGTEPSTALVRQFQQRLISTAMASLAINYQHHYSPFWYSPDSWTPELTPTPQFSYLTTPEGRQSQGLDCSNFSSWNYNNAFGIRLESSVAKQAQAREVTVDWLTGGPATLQTKVVATATEIYRDGGSSGHISTHDEVIDYLNRNLQSGDLLYINGTHLDQDPSSANPADATHVITWVNDNSAQHPLSFVHLPEATLSSPSSPSQAQPQNPSQTAAFVIDSTGSESSDDQGQYYPNGVQIRQFDQDVWYLPNIIEIHRWLTPDNVQTLASSLG